MELRPRTDLGPDRKPVPLDNAQILHRIVPLVEALRVPSAHGSPQASAAVLDRLRELVVDECVFLPANGLLHRDQGPYRPEDFGVHRAGSVEEGGEKRRTSCASGSAAGTRRWSSPSSCASTRRAGC